MYDGEQNHFDFSPNITYKGDNQVLNMTDIDDFSNNQQETVNSNVMNTNSFTGNNAFASTVIPISINGDGKSCMSVAQGQSTKHWFRLLWDRILSRGGFLVPVLDVGTIFEVKFKRVRAQNMSFLPAESDL